MHLFDLHIVRKVSPRPLLAWLCSALLDIGVSGPEPPPCPGVLSILYLIHGEEAPRPHYTRLPPSPLPQEVGQETSAK